MSYLLSQLKLLAAGLRADDAPQWLCTKNVGKIKLKHDTLKTADGKALSNALISAITRRDLTLIAQVNRYTTHLLNMRFFFTNVNYIITDSQSHVC